MTGPDFSLPSPEQATAAIGTLAGLYPSFSAWLASGTPAPEALKRLGLLWLKEQQPAEAARVFSCALALAPNDPVLWLNCGVARDQSGAAQAAACFERSLELSPSQADTWLLLGLARKKNGDPAGCETAYRRALELEPDSPVYWQCLGLLKQELNDCPGAIEAFKACARHGGNHAALQANLGRVHYQIFQIEESAAAFEQAVQLEPGNAHYRRLRRRLQFMRSMMNGAEVESALSAWRASAEGEAGRDVAAELKELLNVSFSLFAGLGQIETARRVGIRHRELHPEDPVIDYLMKALDGGQAIGRSTDAYLKNYFDFFAAGFEKQLVGTLSYDVPQKLGAMIEAIAPADRLFDALDAGCGTGLCGVWMRARSRRLTGVDLSPKMLEQAAKRGCYDELICEELVAYLEKQNSGFDLITAADLLIYFGELKALFAGFARSLKTGGLLVLSTESCATGTFEIRPSGRFAQTANYVRESAGTAFAEVQFIETTIRKEANRPMAGNLFLFRRT